MGIKGDEGKPAETFIDIPVVGKSDLSQIIARGKFEEYRDWRESSLVETNNTDLAISISAIATHASLNSHSSRILHIVAGRLAQMATPRDAWKKHISSGVESDWELVDVQEYSGVVYRFSIVRMNDGFHSNKEGAVKPVGEILMVDVAGNLLERRVIHESQVHMLVDSYRYTIRN